MGDQVSERVTRYLDRHMDWMREVLKELDVLERAMDSGDMEPLLDGLARRTREAEHFQREHKGLMREWNDGAGVSPECRRAVEALTEEAKRLSEALQPRYKALYLKTENLKVSNRRELRALRRDCGVLQKYRPGGDDLTYLDRKA